MLSIKNLFNVPRRFIVLCNIYESQTFQISILFSQSRTQINLNLWL